jgi:spore coat polysaccharide biosynthesis predicted glycosyltransferase SpsG
LSTRGIDASVPARVSLVYDEGPGRGLGHRRRMEALADALQSQGAEPSLSSVEARLPDTDIVVVDSYVHRADDRGRFAARRVVAVDDLYRNLAVELVIDPTPGASPADHPAASTSLTGASYALVEPRLAGLPRRPPGSEVVTLLVATGGTDTEGYGATIAEKLTDLLPGVAIRLVVGPWSSDRVPDGTASVRTSDGLAGELVDADLVVTAGGVTMVEALTLGRPTVAVITAENQRRYVEGAASAGAVVAATVETAAESAASLAGDLRRREDLADAAVRLLDGHGASRVAEALMAGR